MAISQGYLSCSLQGAFYFKSQSNKAVPRMTAKEIEAIRYPSFPEIIVAISDYKIIIQLLCYVLGAVCRLIFLFEHT